MNLAQKYIKDQLPDRAEITGVNVFRAHRKAVDFTIRVSYKMPGRSREYSIDITHAEALSVLLMNALGEGSPVGEVTWTKTTA